MPEFHPDSPAVITEKIARKRIKQVVQDDSGMDSVLIFVFADNSSLRLRYDWIYEWEYVGLPAAAFDGSAENE